MGHKTHPVGFRLGIIKDWGSHWFAANANDYRKIVHEDILIRQILTKRYTDANVSRIEIERNAQEIEVMVWTSRPGIVIGRQGQRVEESRQAIQKISQSKIRLSVHEIRTPELDAALVAKNVAEQLERRTAHRRAILQASSRTMQAGALGVKIIVKGRLGGAEIARKEKVMIGRVPLHTLRADIDFATCEANTLFGKIGVRVWICKGYIIPEREKLMVDEIPAIELNLFSEESKPLLDQEEVLQKEVAE